MFVAGGQQELVHPIYRLLSPLVAARELKTLRDYHGEHPTLDASELSCAALLPFAGAYSGSVAWLLCVRDQAGQPASIHLVGDFVPEREALWPSLDDLFRDELALYRDGRVGAVRFADGEVAVVSRGEFDDLAPEDDAVWLPRERKPKPARPTAERASPPDELDAARRFLSELAERGWIAPTRLECLETQVANLGKILKRRIGRMAKADALVACLTCAESAFSALCTAKQIEELLRSW